MFFLIPKNPSWTGPGVQSDSICNGKTGDERSIVQLNTQKLGRADGFDFAKYMTVQPSLLQIYTHELHNTQAEMQSLQEPQNYTRPAIPVATWYYMCQANHIVGLCMILINM